MGEERDKSGGGAVEDRKRDKALGRLMKGTGENLMGG